MLTEVILFQEESSLCLAYPLRTSVYLNIDTSGAACETSPFPGELLFWSGI